MKLDFASLAFGYSVSSGGNTPNWATSLGQSAAKNYRINDDPSICELLKGMIYCSVPVASITAKIGKGGTEVSGREDDSPIVSAAVFSTVYINDIQIHDGKFILLITRDTSKSHFGRLRIKYGPGNKYNMDDVSYSNEDFFRMAKTQLGLAEDACFFVSDISIANQSDLILRTFVVNRQHSVKYTDSAALHAAWSKITESSHAGKDFTHLGVRYQTPYEASFPYNWIVFGAPGTGKSHLVEEKRKELLGINNESDFERITFHPDYSYANFVGTYKPVPCIDNEGRDTITYEYVPGPFMRVYVNAIKNGRTENVRPFLLIIEEINRANMASVFGDVFQLLDRNANHVSEYPIRASEDMKNYLSKELGGDPDNYSDLRLPNNMFIWATMNSADQGVFPMDTAFKRRWDFTYIGIDDNDAGIRGKYVTLGTKETHRVEWNALRKSINDFLANEKINEDKQLGPYFISRDIVVPPDGGTEIDSKKFCSAFKDKVLMYLFEDAARQKRGDLFKGSRKGSNRYSKICEAFDEQGIGIFHESIQSPINASTITINEYIVQDGQTL